MTGIGRVETITRGLYNKGYNMKKVRVQQTEGLPALRAMGYVLRNAIGKRCMFEERPKKYKFGVENYGEIPGMINKADGDPWDVFAPGYRKELKKNGGYKIKDIVGVYVLENGNNKLAIRVYANGYDEKKAERDIKTYCKKYTGYTKIKGKYFVN